MSFPPSNEYFIIIGLKMNNAPPINAVMGLKICLHNRYTGITVRTEITIEIIHCK